jgi:hypothetical protein
MDELSGLKRRLARIGRRRRLELAWRFGFALLRERLAPRRPGA